MQYPAIHRFFSAFMSIVLVLGLCPITAFADEAEQQQPSSSAALPEEEGGEEVTADEEPDGPVEDAADPGNDDGSSADDSAADASEVESEPNEPSGDGEPAAEPQDASDAQEPADAVDVDAADLEMSLQEESEFADGESPDDLTDTTGDEGPKRGAEQAYAVFDPADGSLTFYAASAVPEPSGSQEVYTGFDTTSYSLTNKAPWYGVRDSILSVSFEGVVSPTSTACWFCYCSNLASIDLSGLDTSGVTSMDNMFYGCSSLTSLDLSGLDTSKVTNMYCMFDGCSSLASLDLSGFDTSNVTNMSHMFYNCSSLASLDLSGFNTSKVISMASMFQNCSSLASLDLSGFNTSKVAVMSTMFRGCWSLTSLDLTGFDTSNVIGVAEMFYGCSSLTSLDLSGFDTSKVTGMERMFGSCSSLTSLDLSSFDTSNVTSMDEMFRYCRRLVSLDVSSFNTSNVTHMDSMFYNCSSLTYLDLSGFDASKVKYMFSLFSDCSSLTKIKLGNSNPFRGAAGYYGNGVLPQSATGWSWGRGSYDSAERFTSSRLASADYSDGAMVGTYYWSEWRPYAVFDASESSLVFHEAGVVPEATSTKAVYTGFDTEIYASSSDVPWNGVHDSIVSVRFEGQIAPRSTANWFADCSSLSSLDLSGLDTSKVSDFSSTFSGCSSLASFDPSGLDMSSANNLSSMFEGCSSLASLDLSSLVAYRVTDFSSMFEGCSSLASLDLSSLDPASAKNMSSMFSGCSSLQTIKADRIGTHPTGNMSHMFYECSSLTSIKGLVNTANAQDVSYMFYGCSALTSGTLSICGAKDISYMFYGCSSLASLDLSYFDTTKAINMSSAFDGCTSISRVVLGDSNPFMGCESASASLPKLEDGWLWVRNASGTSGGYTSEELTTADYSEGKMAGTYDLTKLSSYALLDRSDGSLVFHTRSVVPKAQGKQIVYRGDGGFETESYSSVSEVPWHEYRSLIKNVRFEGSLAPSSVNYWFDDCPAIQTFDLTGLDTSRITGGDRLFANCAATRIILGENVDLHKLDAPPAPSAEPPYTGEWVSPNGGDAMTAAELWAQYDPASMAGEYVWDYEVGGFESFSVGAKREKLRIDRQDHTVMLYVSGDYVPAECVVNFTLGSGAKAYSVNPGSSSTAEGLVSGTHIATIPIGGEAIFYLNDGGWKTVEWRVSIRAYEDYWVLLDSTAEGTAVFGKANVSPIDVGVKNAGNQIVSGLADGMALSGDVGSFTCALMRGGEAFTGDLGIDDEIVLRVQPNEGLDAGTYRLHIVLNAADADAIGAVDVAFTVTKAAQAAPSGVYSVPAIISRADGSILDFGSLGGFDLTKLYEYRLAEDAAWISLTPASAIVEGLAPGTYEVRYQADANHDAGVATTVIVTSIVRCDSSALNAAIAGAPGKWDGIHESADGSDVYLDEKWATPEAFAALQAAIEDAQTVADDVRATQDQVDAAVVALNDAAADFESSCSYGSKLLDFGEAVVEGIQAKTYTGSELTQDLTVTWRGKGLEEGRDYTVSYENNVDATAVSGSKARVIVAGMGNYDATAQTLEFEIEPADIAGATVSAIGSKYYTGDPLTPKPTITFNGKTLSMDVDYGLSYANNVKPGTADGKPTVIATGKGNFKGTIDQAFTIKYDLSKGTLRLLTGKGVNYDEGWGYTTLYPMGTTPELLVRNELGKLLTEGIDYTVSYDVDACDIVVTGIGDYGDWLREPCRIADGPISIADYCSWEMDGIFLYRGEPVKPEPRVFITSGPGDNHLEKDVDYTVEYRDCDAPGRATVVVKGINGFDGQIEIPYEIVKKVDLSTDATVEVQADAVVGSERQVLQTSDAMTPSVEVRISGESGACILQQGKDYELYYTGHGVLGEAKAWAMGLGDCLEYTSGSFKIVDTLNIGKLTVPVLLESEQFIYTGSAIEPKLGEVILPASGYRLTEGVDYTLSYAANTECGVGSVTVMGEGKFTGAVTLGFQIVKDLDKPLLSDCSISISPSRVTYTGLPIKPTVSVAYADGSVPVDSSQWWSPQTSWTDAGDYTMRLHTYEFSVFAGSAEVGFSIEPADIKDATVTGAAMLTDTNQLYSSPTFKFNGIQLKAGKDYVIDSYQVDGSQIMFKLSGVGNFTGTGEFTARVADRELLEGEYSTWPDPSIPCNDDNGIPVYPYQGEPICPSFAVQNTETGQILSLGTDYEIVYRGNDSPGDAYAVVTGIGRYRGEMECPFKISADKIDISKTFKVEAATLHTWNGEPITPVVRGVVSKNKSYQRLNPETDYDVTYKNNDAIGVGTIVVTGKGGYKGKIEVDFAIVDGVINIGDTGQLVVDTQALYTVDGADASVVLVDGVATLPDIYVAAKIGNYTSETLVEGRDYTVSYRNNTSPGTAYAVLTGIGNYTGTYSFRFKAVERIDISKGFFELERDEYQYTGEKIRPDVLAKSLVSGQDLEFMREYVVEYGENTEIGEGTITINGRGDILTGKQVLTFSIVDEVGQRALSDCEIQGIPDTVTYSGSRIEPAFTVRDPATGCALFAQSDYKYRFKDNVNAGTATLELWRGSEKDYWGSVTKTFAIEPLDLSGADAVVTGVEDRVYSGKAQTHDLKVIVGNTELVKGKDYEISYKNNVNAGTAIVTVTGKGNYTGSISQKFEISQASCADKAIELSSTSFTYNGKVQKPTVKLVDGKALVEGDDYTVAYSNESSKVVGKYTVTVTGKGNYAGTSAEATYSIAKANNPMAVKAVAKTVKAKKVKKKKQTVAGCVKFTKKAQGKVTYKKVSGAKKLSINAKTGKITVKKGTKKGTYKIKVRVTAAGNANYKAATKTLTLKVKVS